MRNKKYIKYISFIALFCIYSIILFNYSSSNKTLPLTTYDKELNRFVENYNLLKENWYYYSSDKEVIDAATKAMNESSKHDKYTMYIPSELGKEYYESMESSYVGIGIQYIQYGSYPLVTNVFDNSPALESGVLIGDLITHVDGVDIKDQKAEEIKEKVVGKAKTKVNITVQRNMEKIELELIRDAIESSVSYHIEGEIGYLKINQFSQTTMQESKIALNHFKDNNITKLIIDLRNNPGGYLDSVVDVADLFLPKNKIVLSAKDSKGKIVDYKTKTDEKFEFDIKVLINNSTASAAEVLTATLNELLDVKTYGQTTFGKGIMQSHFNYPDDSIMKYTNAEWLTPKGNQINEKGIKPTNEIDNSPVVSILKENFKTNKDIKNDTVNNRLINYQKALKALGYDIDREDGYYSSKTQEAISQFKEKYHLSEDIDLSKNVQVSIIQQLYIKSNDKEEDKVLEEVIAAFK